MTLGTTNTFESSNLHVLLCIVQTIRSGHYVEVENGFFFLQSELEPTDDTFIALSTEVNWQGGSPGMLLRSNTNGINDFWDVGVFFGRIPKIVETVCVR